MDDMRSFERRVARELDHMAGSEPRIDAAAVARSIAAQAPKRRSDMMFSAVKLVAGGVIVAAFSAYLFMNGILGVPQGPDQPPLMGNAPETSVPSGRPTATPSRPAPTSRPYFDKLASEPFDWTRIDLPREGGVWNSIATLPTGEILILGRRGREHVPYGWLSTDGGRTWEPHAIGAAAADLSNGRNWEPDQLVAWDDMFVIAGTRDYGTDSTGVVLTSADGVTWTTAAEIDEAVFWRLYVLSDGLAILGRTVEKRTCARGTTCRKTGDPAVFTSTDATDWQTHRLHLLKVQDIARAPGGDIARSDAGVSLVLVSSATSGENGMLLRSEDGDTWTPMDLPVLPGTDGYVRASALAWAPSGFVLALYRDTGPHTYPAGSIWHSNDGLSWERVADTDATVFRIIADDRSLVAFPGPYDFERQPEEIPVLRSTDGRDWTTVAGFGLPYLVDATITADGRVLALITATAAVPHPRGYAVVFGDPT